MPLFPPPLPAPQLISADFTELDTSSFLALTAGVAYLSPFSLLTPVTITQMRCMFSGTPTGNVDMGIYDSTGTNGVAGNLLGHTGAIVAATGVFTQSLTSPLPLSPGEYWMAWLDTVADSIGKSSITTGVTGTAPWMRSTSSTLTVLVSSLTPIATANKVVLVALRSGGFS